MFKKSRRVNSSLFKFLVNANTVHTKNFSLKFKKINNLGNNKFSVVIAKKISKKSVVRNNLKRRVVYAVKNTSLYSNTRSFGSFDFMFVVYPKRGAELLSTKDIREEVKELFSKFINTQTLSK